MEKKIRYGIIGCGTHAYRGHFLPGCNVPELELVALCDPNISKVFKPFMEANRGPELSLFKNEDAVFAAKDIDAVVITSPDRFHAMHLAKAIRAGKHVLVDKPAAANLDDLTLLQHTLAEARERGLVVSSCHPRRFNPAYVGMKSLLGEHRKELGALLRLELDFFYHKPSKKGLHTGLLADHLNHEFDFANYLLGPSTYVLHKLHDEEDRYEVAGTRTDGVTLHFSGTRRSEGRIYPETVRLRFEKGVVERITGSGQTNTTCFDLAQDTYFPQVSSPNVATDYEAAFTGIMRDFAQAIRTGDEPYLSHDDIYGNSRVCVALTVGNACSA
ncbi:MAG: hypothetical protein RLZZ324_704 [Candidatus Parcubacteria bacterium]|jgi:predicted dehydrogenase